jgi:hypothetical protein
LLQCLIGIALLAQDHEIVGIGYDPTAEALLQSALVDLAPIKLLG